MTARSRYDGFPQVFLSGDKVKALTHLGRAKSLLSEVQRIREVAGVPIFKRTLQVGDTQISAKSMGGVDAIYIHTEALSERVSSGGEAFRFPVVLSGYIKAAYIGGPVDEDFLEFKRNQKAMRVEAEAYEEGRTATEEELALSPEEERAARYPTGLFSPTQATVRAYGPLLDHATVQEHKTNVLRADAAGSFAEMAGATDTGLYYRAYRYVRGTWLAGSLGKCLQAVLGLHLSSVAALQAEPEFLQRDERRAREYAEGGALMASDAYVQAVQKAGGFVSQYSASWAKSDGLVRGFNGWWLVRITPQRILARRLPVFYGSDLPEYVKHYEDLGLSGLADFIREFGGLPTGEAFGDAQAIDAGIDAGYIFDITPGNMPFADGFYAPYQYCSWSFSESGREAHNTALRYDVGSDLYYSRWASLFFEPQNVGGLERLAARVVVNSTAAVFAPLRRKDGVSYQVLPIKVPYGYQGLVENINVRTQNSSVEGRPNVYNAVVWAGYVGGALHTINYHYNAVRQSKQVWSGEPPPEYCPVGSAWAWAVDKGTRDVPANTYSNAWDTRQVLSLGSERWAKRSVKRYEFIFGGHYIEAPEWSWFTANAVFEARHEHWKMGGDSFEGNTTVYTDRAAYSCSSRLDKAVQESYSRTYSYEAVGAPWVAYGFRCFVRISSIGIPCLEKPVWQYCQQKCNYMVGGKHSDTLDRLICYTETTEPGCHDYVETRPPERCTDVTVYLRPENRPEPPPLPEDYSTDIPAKETTFSGVVFNPVAYTGHSYKLDAFKVLWDMEAISAPSPDPASGIYQSITSTRNCVGYEYSCFANSVSATIGYSRIGALHSGVDSYSTALTFVGVLD